MPASETKEGLLREVRLVTAITVVIGTVIGSGIFFGANRVAGGVDTAGAMFAVWIGAGLVTLLGALTYAEFGAMYPKSGGDYVFVSNSLGPRWGFLAGWSAFSVNIPASTAFLALAFANQMDVLKPENHALLGFEGFADKFTAIGIVAIFTIINYIGVRQGGATQRILTFAKVGLMIGLAVFAFLSPRSDYTNFFDVDRDGDGRFVLALVAAFFAFDGWSSITRISGEVKNPQRTLPKALTLGVLAVIGIYVTMNAAYLLVLGLDGMEAGSAVQTRPIASAAAAVLVGGAAEAIVAVIVGASILGTINGLTLSGPRIYFAMARDRLFFPALAKVHESFRTPHVSITIQSALSALLILFVPFDFLQNYVVLAAWVSYLLAGIGLMRHRRTHPNVARPYRVPLYPWVPLGFIVFASSFLLYIIIDYMLPAFQGQWENPAFLLLNIAMLAIGFPIYELIRRKYPPPAAAP
jgi:basic amino acid/polyamine antiporter, APA family